MINFLDSEAGMSYIIMQGFIHQNQFLSVGIARVQPKWLLLKNEPQLDATNIYEVNFGGEGLRIYAK